jgi:hypothetical protein
MDLSVSLPFEELQMVVEREMILLLIPLPMSQHSKVELFSRVPRTISVDLVVKQQRHISLDQQVAEEVEQPTMTLLMEMQIAREMQSSYDIETFYNSDSLYYFCSNSESKLR